MRALFGALLVSLVCLTGCAATKPSVSTAPANVTVFQMSSYATAKPYLNQSVQFTAVFLTTGGTPPANIGVRHTDTEVLIVVTNDEGTAHPVFVGVPGTDPVLPTLKQGDHVLIKGTPLPMAGNTSVYFEVASLTKQ